MKRAAQIRKGAQGFELFYSGLYGDRWEQLAEALRAPVRQVARINAFADRIELLSRVQNPISIKTRMCEAIEIAAAQSLCPQRQNSGLHDLYFLDLASILAAESLLVQEGDEVLDLCAAPGGKSLILAEALFRGGALAGSLTCNELSPNRRGRLRAVLEQYLPRAILSHVKVTGHDGGKWCLHQPDHFDRILLDAPCSGERHLLNSPEELKLWSPARSKNLAVRQYALLTSALGSVKVGGSILYSTCSISPLENDEVIRRLTHRRGGEIEIQSVQAEIGETTEFGWAILPDRTGYGPIYFSLLMRT